MRKYLLILLVMQMLYACSENDGFSEQNLEARITVVTSISGPGDNGYNDQILAGVLAVANNKNVNMSLVHPATIEEAKTIFDNWKNTATAEPKLLVLAGSDYEELARTNGTGLDDNHNVLVFESDGEGMPDGVKTFRISRYGVSYFAGCMAQNSDTAYVLMAMKGDDTLEEAAQGFSEGFKKYSAKGVVNMSYLSESVDGYQMADSAYRWACYKKAAFIYPLAGGSNLGVYKCIRENIYTDAYAAGMDVDCSGYSALFIPFSVIIDIKTAIINCLSAWIEGNELPDKRTFTIGEGITDIKMNDSFIEGYSSWGDYFFEESYWIDMYNKYLEEAIVKEDEHEE